VHRNVLPFEEAKDALGALLALPVSLIDLADLHQRAWELATRFNQPTTDDANYLAVADVLDCPFWTTDSRLYNSIKDDFPSIELIS
jgi:predicted nucleic acid-binding protein